MMGLGLVSASSNSNQIIDSQMVAANGAIQPTRKHAANLRAQGGAEEGSLRRKVQ
jgi:hypothetical protein